jgi:Fanconi anemia group M protein
MAKGQAHLAAAPAVARARGPRGFRTVEGFVEHPLLRHRTVSARDYQLDLATRALSASTLVLLPAGLGKTVVAALVAAERLRGSGGFVLMLAPSRSLARQHEEALEGILADSVVQRTHLLTGSTSRAQRDRAWREAWLIVSTPETVAQEIESGALALTRCSLLIVDEAHRAIGGSAYAEVARALRRDRPRGLTLALAATAGADRRRVTAIMDALRIRHVESRDRDDPDVAPHLRPVEMEVVGVDLTPGMKEIQGLLEKELEPLAHRLAKVGLLPRGPVRLLTRAHLGAAADMLRRPGEGKGAEGATLWLAHGQAVLLVQALEALETQGCASVCLFLERMGQDLESPRAERALAGTRAVREALGRARALHSEPHPKVQGAIELLRDLFREKPGAKAVLVVHHEQAAKALAQRVSMPPPMGLGVPCAVTTDDDDPESPRVEGPARPAPVGEASASGAFPVRVVRSRGGGASNLPPADLVAFFDAGPFPLRAMGPRRPAPGQAGARFAVLVARDTRDEGALRASERQERGQAPPARLVVPPNRSRWSSPGPNQVLPLGEEFSVDHGKAQGRP